MFLPTTNKEVEARGWDELDVIMLCGVDLEVKKAR